MSNSGRGHLSLPAAMLLLVGVLAAGVLAVRTAPDGVPAATWWPAAGIAATLTALTPRRWWWWIAPSLVVLTTVANLTADRHLGMSVWFGVANAGEALVVAALLRRRTGTLPELTSIETFLRLVVASLIGAASFATVAATGLTVLLDAPFTVTWRSLCLSHAASILVILPVTMAVAAARPIRQSWELPVQLTAVTAVAVYAFGPGQTLSLEYLPLPLLIWAALRFDMRIVAAELVGLAVLVTTTSALQHGPFGFDYDRGELTAYGLGAVTQAYIVAMVVMTLPLAIVVEQQRRLIDRTISSERLFRRNFTESVVGMLLMRSSGAHLFEITEMNDAAAGMLGEPETTVGRTLGEVLDTDEPLESIAARMLAGSLDGWRAETSLRTRLGSRVNVAVSLLSTQPEPMFAAQLLDVSAEHDARRGLEAAEKLTGATLDTTAAIIIVCDLYGQVVRVNRATTALTGFSEAELVGREIWDLPFAPPGSSGYPAGLPDDPAEQVSRETDLVTNIGERRRVRWNTGYVRDEHNRPTYVVITGTDLTAERRAAGLNRHLLEAAITTALIGIDPRGRITVFNVGAVNLLGYDAQDMVGTPFVRLLDAEQLAERCPGDIDEERFAALVAGIDAAGETGARDWTWVGSDGRKHTVSMTVSVAADTVAARLGYLCVGRDVTESRASQELLVAALDKERIAVERLRQLDSAKNEFVSTVSHELRTPVASIVGYTEMLQDGTVDDPTPGQRRLLGSIERNGRRLITLCEDLLTLGGLDAGATHWDREQVDLAELVAAGEDAVRPLLAGRSLEMVFVAPEPVLVLGDRKHLDRVLINLLSNAVKFTENGGRIECRAEYGDGEARLVVSDSGIGIPQEEQSGLFQRFFRSSTAQRRAIQGTGLGLSIVAATVAAHGGRIDVRSAHLQGTTITVRLPVARGAASRSEGAESEPVRPGSPR